MRITRRFTFVILFLSIILLIVCQPFHPVLAENRPNTLTIWGFFPKKYVEMHINNYEAVDPQTKIIYTEYDFYSLAKAFKERSHQGLGPDAVILPEREIPELIKLNLIQKLDGYNLDTTNWHPKSLIPFLGWKDVKV